MQRAIQHYTTTQDHYETESLASFSSLLSYDSSSGSAAQPTISYFPIRLKTVLFQTNGIPDLISCYFVVRFRTNIILILVFWTGKYNDQHSTVCCY